MPPAASKFPKQTQVLFLDTMNRGGISVRGIQLETEDGIIEGPADLAEEIRPHGFIALEEWFNAIQPKAVDGIEAVKEELERVKKERLAAVKKYPQLEALLNNAERAELKKSGSK